MVNRIYFLTSEIIPFAETYPLASFSKEIPVVFNERKYDFRLMMPKYTFISERRYILREVIRLRDMELVYRGEPVTASVKSAFIPNTKVQVYFQEHDDYYNNDIAKLYDENRKSDSGKNIIRFGYFAAAALTTLNYLRWKPEVIICNDWQMSMIPLMIASGLLDDSYFEGVKILQIVQSKSDKSRYAAADYKKIGIRELDSSLIEKDQLDCLAAAFTCSDHTLFLNREENLAETYLRDPVFKQLIEPNKDRISTYELKGESPEDWQKLADEIVRIVEKL